MLRQVRQVSRLLSVESENELYTIQTQHNLGSILFSKNYNLFIYLMLHSKQTTGWILCLGESDEQETT